MYDRPKYFESDTLARNKEIIINPSLTILACTTGDWMAERLRGSLLTGGFVRRMNFVYDTYEGRPIDWPVITPEAAAAKQRILARLPALSKVAGEYKRTEEGAKVFFDWYTKNKINLPNDPMMRGYLKTKDIQLVKVMMLADLAEYRDPTFLITPDLIELGLAILEPVEKNLPKLFMAAGRNELAVPQQRLLDLIEREPYCGMIPEKLLLREDKDLGPDELLKVLRHLRDGGRVIKTSHRGSDGVLRIVYFTERRYKEATDKGEIKPT
jgi:hypothetical protein